jgi:hypothetical protein
MRQQLRIGSRAAAPALAEDAAAGGPYQHQACGQQRHTCMGYTSTTLSPHEGQQLCACCTAHHANRMAFPCIRVPQLFDPC